MSDIQIQAMKVLRDVFPLPGYEVHCEEVSGGVHGGEHYLAVGLTFEGIRRFFLLRVDTVGLETTIANMVKLLNHGGLR